MLYITAVQSGKITFGETEIMDGIQEIGFTHPVLPTDTDNPFGQVKSPVAVVFELDQ
jgi:hypothetical protein